MLPVLRAPTHGCATIYTLAAAAMDFALLRRTTVVQQQGLGSVCHRLQSPDLVVLSRVITPFLQTSLKTTHRRMRSM